jgi:hypothetical protein
MNHAKTSFSTEIFAGAIISVVQYLAPLRLQALLLLQRIRTVLYWTTNVSLCLQTEEHNACQQQYEASVCYWTT